MAKLNIICIIFNLLILISCSNISGSKSEEVNNEVTYKELIDILERQYGYRSSDSLDILVFVPSSYCKNCLELTPKALSETQNAKIHIFSSFSKRYFRGFNNIYTDNNNLLVKYKFINFSSKIIVVNHRAIIESKSPNDLQNDLLEILKKYY